MRVSRVGHADAAMFSPIFNNSKSILNNKKISHSAQYEHPQTFQQNKTIFSYVLIR